MLHPALDTPLLEILGCRVPVMLAGMGGVARHELAAAVSRAGGFGCMGMVREPVSRIEAEVAAYRQLSDRPFAINLIPAATEPALLREQVAICLRLRIPAMTLFWDVDTQLVRHLKAEGLLVIHQVGDRHNAAQALEAGADVLIAQGVEAGGHVHGLTATLALLPEIVAMSPVPVVASGGIANGNTLVAALALGAQGVSCGTAFLATHEANAHVHHKERIVAADAGDTVYSTRFFRNWHVPAPVRVLENAVTRGELDKLYRKQQSPIIGQQDGAPVFLFSTDSPLRDASGDIDSMAIYAGQSCGQVKSVCSAAERLRQIVREAEACLTRLHAGKAASPDPIPAILADADQENGMPAPDAAPDARRQALVARLQMLLAAERAGVMTTARSLRENDGSEHQRQLLANIHQGETDNCWRLRLCLTRLNQQPCRDISPFHEKAMTLTDLEQRLDFIDKRQHWTLRKLKECLELCEDDTIAKELQTVMHTHENHCKALAPA